MLTLLSVGDFLYHRPPWLLRTPPGGAEQIDGLLTKVTKVEPLGTCLL